MTTELSADRPLRHALRANGVFSLSSSIIMILASQYIGETIGVPSTWLIATIGVGLVLYSASLAWVASPPGIDPIMVYAAAVLDIIWVVASVVVVYLGMLTTTGNWIVAAVADVVLVFGLVQLY